MFVLTEPTPNPEAIKFIPDARLTDGASWSFEREAFEAVRAPLAARLFALEGVRRVFIAPDFVTVTRASGGPGWSALRYPVIGAIADHLQSGEPAVASRGDEATPSDGEDALEGEIRQVLSLYVRPGLARDGGDVVIDRFERETGVLWIRMQGACGGCPSARLTLKAGVETIMRRYVPEVLRVEETAAPAAAPGAPSPLRRWISSFGNHGRGKVRTVFTHAGRRIERQDQGAS